MVPELKIFPNFKLVYAYFLLLHLDSYTLKLINPDGHNGQEKKEKNTNMVHKTIE
jgi:hypothetical protein